MGGAQHTRQNKQTNNSQPHFYLWKPARPAYPSSHCTKQAKRKPIQLLQATPHTGILPETARKGEGKNGRMVTGGMLASAVSSCIPSPIPRWALLPSPFPTGLVLWGPQLGPWESFPWDWEASSRSHCVPVCSWALISQISASTRSVSEPPYHPHLSPLLGRKSADTAEIWVNWLIPETTNFSPEGNGRGGFFFFFFSCVNNPNWRS